MSIAKARAELQKHASKEKAAILRHFFKTGPGEYGEGDKFIGITVPLTREVAKKFKDLPEKDSLKLLASPIHEERLLALFILVQQYEKGNASLRQRIAKLFLKNARLINNWDLVDLSAPKILGR